ncbi:LuxR C-terminal-related transcriptional regulator [Carboxylicivirga taeanensis]|uniref:LuxR C-terminal-related transcriptional regulator n=1 Tax=Carboxylicivirga taeanensis TaxID=1416875 RepID=UPI003F6DFCC6
MLRTKLQRPNLAPDLLLRTGLLKQLNHNIHKPVTLISAPSGYGKSVIVSQWIENYKVKAAWLSLDNEHQDLSIFIEYVVAALQTIIEDDFVHINELINGQKLPPVEMLYEALIDVLEPHDEELVFVLDDYQVIKNDRIHELINMFLTYPAERLHLVIICRYDPPLNINKLRLFNRINELRMKDLEFDLDATKVLINQKIGRCLSEQDISLIHKRTEGWVLGLQMILMTDEIQRGTSTMQRVAHFSLKEYSFFFTDLTLKRFSAEFREALYLSSILERFNSELLDALLLGIGASSKISGNDFIHDLIANNLFVYSLDNERVWFRYHHFFREMLFRQLQQNYSDEQISSLHKIASSCFDKSNFWDESFQHALKSGDVELAVSIFNKHRINFFNTDQFRRIHQWMCFLPKGTIEKDLGLLVTRAILDEARYDLVAMRADLDLAKKLVEKVKDDSRENKQLLGEYYTVRSLLDFSLENYEEALAHSNKALSLLEDKTQMISNYAFAFCLYALNALGRYDEARKHVENVLEQIPTNTSIPFIYLQTLKSYLNSFRGNIKEIAEALTKVFPLFKKNRLWVLLSSVSYYLGSAHYQFNNLEKAVEYTEALKEHYYAGRPYWDLPTIYTKALSFLALGETQKLKETICEIDEVTENTGLEAFYELTKAFKVDLALRQGNIEGALELSKITDFDTVYLDYAFYFQQLTYIRLLITVDSTLNRNQIEELLEKYINKGRLGHKYNLLMQVLPLQSIFLYELGDKEAALKSLKEAMNLAESNGFIRIFVDLGEPMKLVLNALQLKEPNSNYLSTILEAFKKELPFVQHQEQCAKTTTKNDFDILSIREAETLQYIAQGFRNKEIADILNISVETVKSHVKSCLRKLEAKNRVELVHKALYYNEITE